MVVKVNQRFEHHQFGLDVRVGGEERGKETNRPSTGVNEATPDTRVRGLQNRAQAPITAVQRLQEVTGFINRIHIFDRGS